MANLGGVFDANTVEPNTTPPPLPNGWYTVRITDSETKPTKDRTGQYLELKMKVVEPAQFANRVIYDRLNLWNKNATASEIAQKTLSAICRATGVMQVQDSAALHGIPLQVKVIVVPPKDGYDEGNEVKGYRSLAAAAEAAAAQNGTGAVATAAPAFAAAATAAPGFGAPAATPAGAAPPWAAPAATAPEPAPQPTPTPAPAPVPQPEQPAPTPTPAPAPAPTQAPAFGAPPMADAGTAAGGIAPPWART
jgi:hypothetical protein